jgi:coenzyme PQQ biosynthesis protein PqqD
VTLLPAAARPRLGRGVRLRLDRLTGKTLLLRPEQGFELQGSALDIVRLCSGEMTVAAMVESLAGMHLEIARERIAEDVERLLTELGRRGLVVLEESQRVEKDDDDDAATPTLGAPRP